MSHQCALILVPASVPPPTAADMLAALVPRLVEAEATVARLKREMDEQRRQLANDRHVAFIREEAVRREFAG